MSTQPKSQSESSIMGSCRAFGAPLRLDASTRVLDSVSWLLTPAPSRTCSSTSCDDDGHLQHCPTHTDIAAEGCALRRSPACTNIAAASAVKGCALRRSPAFTDISATGGSNHGGDVATFTLGGLVASQLQLNQGLMVARSQLFSP